MATLCGLHERVSNGKAASAIELKHHDIQLIMACHVTSSHCLLPLNLQSYGVTEMGTYITIIKLAYF